MKDYDALLKHADAMRHALYYFLDFVPSDDTTRHGIKTCADYDEFLTGHRPGYEDAIK